MSCETDCCSNYFVALGAGRGSELGPSPEGSAGGILTSARGDIQFQLEETLRSRILIALRVFVFFEGGNVPENSARGPVLGAFRRAYEQCGGHVCRVISA